MESRPPPRLDSWPAKSDAQKLEWLLPTARIIAGGIARNCPPGLYGDIQAAAAIGAWDVVRRHRELDREATRKLTAARVRGAILDELRAQDWLPRRARANGNDFIRVGLDDLEAEQLSTPPEQESNLAASADAERLWAALESLSRRDRKLLSDLYIRGIKASVVAARMGISQPRVSQIRKRAVERLRQAIELEK